MSAILKVKIVDIKKVLHKIKERLLKFLHVEAITSELKGRLP